MFGKKDEYLIWRQLVAKLAVSSRDALYFNYFVLDPLQLFGRYLKTIFPAHFHLLNIFIRGKKSRSDATLPVSIEMCQFSWQQQQQQ